VNGDSLADGCDQRRNVQDYVVCRSILHDLAVQASLYSRVIVNRDLVLELARMKAISSELGSIWSRTDHFRLPRAF
jgi:hypothetical protein